MGINQIYDVDIDSVNKPFLPVAAGICVDLMMSSRIPIFGVTMILSLRYMLANIQAKAIIWQKVVQPSHHFAGWRITYFVTSWFVWFV